MISHTKTSTVSAQSCAIATILNLVLPCMRKKKTGGDVLSRSDGKWINVNELLKPFGGGGHVSAAGLKYQTDNVEELKKQILDRVAEMKKKQ